MAKPRNIAGKTKEGEEEWRRPEIEPGRQRKKKNGEGQTHNVKGKIKMVKARDTDGKAAEDQMVCDCTTKAGS